jgi:hypothetical protein
MTSGSGSEAGVKKLRSVSHLTDTRRPVHRSWPDDDAMFQNITKFIGSSEMLTLQIQEGQEEDNVEAKEMFSCGDHDDVNVFSLKAVWNGKVIVSFDPFYQNTDPLVKQRDVSHRVTTFTSDFGEEVSGRRSLFEVNKKSRYATQTKNLASKSHESESHIWALKQIENLCVIQTINYGHSSDIRWVETLFPISSKECRAFDVGGDGTLFVVVEEAEKPETERKVLLYSRPNVLANRMQSPVCTYQPPLTPFQPADVCFFKLQGQEVGFELRISPRYHVYFSL